MGWLIDPDEQTVFVYRPGQLPEAFEEPETPLPVPVFAEEFSLTVGELFAWLQD